MTWRKQMIINFNNGMEITDPFTPIIWECLGFKFKNKDMIDKLNSFNKRHNPMMKNSDDGNISYHLIYNNNNISSLILKVNATNTKKFVEDISPVSYSSLLPRYQVKINKIEDKKYLLSYFDNKNNEKLLSSYVNLPPFQSDFNQINLDNIEILQDNLYLATTYFLTTSAILFKDEESLNEKITSMEGIISDKSDYQGICKGIAGRVLFANVYINTFTGLRFYEIGFVCKGNEFIVYMPSNYLSKFPQNGDYILCHNLAVFGEILNIYDGKANSHIAHPKFDNNEQILTLYMQYVAGYDDNVVRIKRDEIFDGDIKINYLSITLFPDKIKVKAELFKLDHPAITINMTKDGNFEQEIHELKKLKLKPNHDFVEDLVDGVYWYVIYKDIYLEGHENIPSNIVDIKKILNFDEIIDALRKDYINSIKKNKD